MPSSATPRSRRSDGARLHPAMLRAEVGGAREVEAHGATVGEVIEDLVERYPALRPQLYRDGDLGELVNVYLGGVSSAPSTRPSARRRSSTRASSSAPR